MLRDRVIVIRPSAMIGCFLDKITERRLLVYIVLDNTKMLTKEEIDANYDGKWVFLTNCEFTPGSKLIRGIPRVIADKQSDGVDDGIYDVYMDIEQFGESCGYNLLRFDYLIKNVVFLPKGSCDEADNIYV